MKRKVLDMWEVCEKAMASYIKSGAADDLIRERADGLNRRNQCKQCISWDTMTMICNKSGETMMGCQSCKYFQSREKQ